MTSKDDQIQAKIAEQASDWLVENDERPLNAQESAALEAWFKASPLHIEEFLGLAVIARDLSAASAHPRHSVESLVARARADDDGKIQRPWPRVFAVLTDLREIGRAHV